MSSAFAGITELLNDLVEKYKDDPEISEALDAGRKEGETDVVVRRQALVVVNPDRAYGIAVMRESLANVKSSSRPKAKIDTADAWIDSTGLFEVNADSAPTFRAYEALMRRRRGHKMIVRERLAALGVR